MAISVRLGVRVIVNSIVRIDADRTDVFRMVDVFMVGFASW